MRTALRAAVVLSALVSLALAGAAGVRAASPEPTVGGTLAVDGKTISVYSGGNVPAHVYLTATDARLSESDFEIAPGATHSLTFSGPAVGTVTALYVTDVAGQESGSAALTIGLVPAHVPPPPFDWAPVGLGGIVTFGMMLLLRRWRPWRYRLVRTT